MFKSEKSNSRDHTVNRRNMLLGGTTLAAASAIASGTRIQVAQAQQQGAARRDASRTS